MIALPSLLACSALALLTGFPLDRPERGPLDAGQLLSESTHVVTGRVVKVVARPDPVEVGGVGNSDWIIECLLDVESVQKGDGISVGDRVTALASLAKARNFFDLVGYTGHSPIPDEGHLTRAHLVFAGDGEYRVVHPNGFTAGDQGVLREPPWLDELRRERAINVYGLPGFLAASLILLIVIAICWVIFRVLSAVGRRLAARR